MPIFDFNHLKSGFVRILDSFLWFSCHAPEEQLQRSNISSHFISLTTKWHLKLSLKQNIPPLSPKLGKIKSALKKVNFTLKHVHRVRPHRQDSKTKTSSHNKYSWNELCTYCRNLCLCYKVLHCSYSVWDNKFVPFFSINVQHFAPEFHEWQTE